MRDIRTLSIFTVVWVNVMCNLDMAWRGSVTENNAWSRHLRLLCSANRSSAITGRARVVAHNPHIAKTRLPALHFSHW